MQKVLFLLSFVSLVIFSCEAPLEDVLLDTPSDEIEISESTPVGLDKAYWYSGKAEVSKYELKQNRYRDVHDGELVTIFVTEDFLTDKQVKNDTYTNNNSTSILKLNSLRRFTTGIYDYSMMTSVFTRADGSGTEKITLSSQDWCGQTFVQLNKVGKKKYKIQLRSYFEKEGDRDVTVTADLLEDEVPNLLRINPDLVPEGTVNILPSMSHLRFSHDKMKSQQATILKTKSATGDHQLTITYPSDQRTIEFSYTSKAPRVINTWVDSFPSAFDKEVRATTATLLHQIQEPYWSQNAASDREKRKRLSLNGFGD